MIEETKSSAKKKMEEAVNSFGAELRKVRTGRAQVSMLDSVKVNYYGTPTPLNQLASIGTPDAKSFVITPYDPSALKEIEAAIVKSDLGMTPQNDGKVIRLKVPELTEERRKDLVKTVKKQAEDARVAVRMARREANEAFKKAKKSKDISEDEEKRAENDIQKLTDEFIKKVDKMAEDKENDLMTV